jgi:hypothetical protein
MKFIVYVPVSDYVSVRRSRKVRTSLYIKQKMLTLGRVATRIIFTCICVRTVRTITNIIRFLFFYFYKTNRAIRTVMILLENRDLCLKNGDLQQLFLQNESCD